MYKLLSINASDFSELSNHLSLPFDPVNVGKVLSSAASPDVASVLIEYPYVDKDYRSTYYNFYSKKGRFYGRQCVRLHFFTQGIDLAENFKLQPSDDTVLSEHYLGFMVLRPTWSWTIGRTAISPKFLKSFSGHVMLAQHKVHLLGKRINIAGFPWMQQHTDIAVCAHVACWSILRYYSERFSGHREYLIHDITQMASQHDPGGLLPSRGLNVGQATRILAEGGVYPDIYNKTNLGESFLRYLYAYIESGFPVFAAMNGRRHAITIIGHGPVNAPAPKPGANAGDVQYSWDSICTLVAVDDNWMPYRGLPDKPPNEYGVGAIDMFVVPLPDKIYLPAESVERHALSMLKTPPFGLDFSFVTQPVVRYLLTTSSTMQKWALENEDQFPPTLLAALMDLPLPRFIWMVEIGNLTTWGKGRCNLRFVFDATASAQEKMVFVLLHDASLAVVHDRSSGKQTVSKIPLVQPGCTTNRSIDMPLFDSNLHSF